MPLHSILKRASGLLLGSNYNSQEENLQIPPFYDGEVVYCGLHELKN